MYNRIRKALREHRPPHGTSTPQSFKKIMIPAHTQTITSDKYVAIEVLEVSYKQERQRNPDKNNLLGGVTNEADKVTEGQEQYIAALL